MVLVSENKVMDFYLDLIKKDKIKFLVNQEEKKKTISDLINNLKSFEDIHDKISIAKELWKVLFEASMSYIDSDKQGYDNLFKYFNEFVEFEELIFASDSFYRDHTLHSLWVYFLGEYIYNKPEFSGLYSNFNNEIRNTSRVRDFFLSLNKPQIFSDFYRVLDNVQRIIELEDSVRCVTALTHDLGYPLKKIQKINKSIGKILPYFSISKYGEFSFQFETVQQYYIENLIELLANDINMVIEMGGLEYEEQILISEISNKIGLISEAINNDREFDPKHLNEIKEYLEKIDGKEAFLLRRIFVGRGTLQKSMSKLLRFANDFENYQHGIMSSYILMKLVNAFSNIQINYSDPSNLQLEGMDFAGIHCKLRILVAMADHTSPGYQMREIDSYSAHLQLIDEIEEFSRISRADQYRQFVNQFCKTDIRMNNSWLEIDFIFDDKNIAGLNPEITFRDKCKKFLKIFDIPNLCENLKIRFRCIGKLPTNSNTYELKIVRNEVLIRINDEPMEISKYLKTKEFFGE
ncbi:MAG: hypothetical protein EAX90_06180 [Candidatus Heimdallarchaeota archaeon]|nr:hypothetical protein [Candidatus Heimdallarchaeota archaeon]